MEIDLEFLYDLFIFLFNWFIVIYICFKLLDESQEQLQVLEENIHL